MGLRFWIIAIGLGSYFFLWVSHNRRGRTIADQQQTIHRQDSTLSATRGQLAGTDKHVQRLASDSASLAFRVDALVLANKQVEVDLAQLQGRQAGLIQQYKASVGALSAEQKKHLADVPTGGVGNVATTVADSGLNGDIALLKGELRQYADTLVPLLTKQNSLVTSERNSLVAKNVTLDNKLAVQRENILGVATFVYEKKRQASKGVLRQLFNQGKIKVLGEVDEKLGGILSTP